MQYTYSCTPAAGPRLSPYVFRNRRIVMAFLQTLKIVMVWIKKKPFYFPVLLRSSPPVFHFVSPLSLGFFSLYPLPLAFHPGIQRRRAGGPGGGARALPEKEGAARAPALLAGGAHRRLPWIREQEGVATLPRYAHRRRRRGPRRSCVEPRRPT